MQRLEKNLDGVQRLFNLMKKEKLALKIARKINKRNGKLESFHYFHFIRSYFYHLSMDDLERIAWQFWDQYIRNEKEILKNQPLPSNRGKKKEN